jgi:hypothetical protein
MWSNLIIFPPHCSINNLASSRVVRTSRLSRIIHSRFPREVKGKVYGWQPDDPQIELSIKAVKELKTEMTRHYVSTLGAEDALKAHESELTRRWR